MTTASVESAEAATADDGYRSKPKELRAVAPAAGSRVRHDLAALAALTVLWITPAYFIGLRGEFPLNDDWAYTHSVKHLLEEGRFWRTNWTFIPIITHTLIGAAFSKLFGFSFETLRLSGLVMGWAGLVGAYALCRTVGARATLAALAALVVAFNPIYLNLSYTFMTDIPFVALLVWAVCLLLVGLRRSSYALMSGGVACAIAATLSRQFGLAVAGAFALTLVATAPRNPKRWAAALAILALNLAIYFALPPLIYGYLHTIKSDSWMANAAVSDAARQSTTFVRNVVFGFIYLGLFLLPLATIITLQWLGSRRRTLLASATAAAALLFMILLATRWRLPRYNMIYDLGLGPVVIGLKTLYSDTPHPGLWWTLTAIGGASACVILVACVAHILARRRELFQPEFLLPAATAAAYAPVLLLFGMDRYLLPLLPMLAAVAVIPITSQPCPRRLALVATILAVLAIGAFSVCGTRDYLTRHRASWALVNDLTSRGVTPDRISGGFEFNAWNNFNAQRRRIAWNLKGPWVIDDEYLISYAHQLPEYTPVESRTYPRLIPPGRETVTLYRRNP